MLDKMTKKFRAFCIASLTLVASSGWGAGQSPEVFVMGALGDSITSGFNSKNALNNKNVAWNSGTDTLLSKSHYWFLKNIFPDTFIKVYNYSIPGVASGNLPMQAKLMAAHRPDYVSLTIGANDLFYSGESADFAVERFKENIRRSVNILLSSNKNVKILFALVPDVLQLKKAMIQSSYCVDFYKKFGAVFPHVLQANASDSEIKIFGDKWLLINQSIIAVAKEFPSQVKVPPIAVAYTPFTIDLVSTIDCFHPNVAGQNFLSKLSWQYSWF